MCYRWCQLKKETCQHAEIKKLIKRNLSINSAVRNVCPLPYFGISHLHVNLSKCKMPFFK